eukprot:scaffold10262_cov131-Chaetoceros_neogracile.AAC.6
MASAGFAETAFCCLPPKEFTALVLYATAVVGAYEVEVVVAIGGNRASSSNQKTIDHHLLVIFSSSSKRVES